MKILALIVDLLLWSIARINIGMSFPSDLTSDICQTAIYNQYPVGSEFPIFSHRADDISHMPGTCLKTIHFQNALNLTVFVKTLSLNTQTVSKYVDFQTGNRMVQESDKVYLLSGECAQHNPPMDLSKLKTGFPVSSDTVCIIILPYKSSQTNLNFPKYSGNGIVLNARVDWTLCSGLSTTSSTTGFRSSRKSCRDWCDNHGKIIPCNDSQQFISTKTIKTFNSTPGAVRNVSSLLTHPPAFLYPGSSIITQRTITSMTRTFPTSTASSVLPKSWTQTTVKGGTETSILRISSTLADITKHTEYATVNASYTKSTAPYKSRSKSKSYTVQTLTVNSIYNAGTRVPTAHSHAKRKTSVPSSTPTTHNNSNENPTTLWTVPSAHPVLTSQSRNQRFSSSPGDEVTTVNVSHRANSSTMNPIPRTTHSTFKGQTSTDGSQITTEILPTNTSIPSPSSTLASKQNENQHVVGLIYGLYALCGCLIVTLLAVLLICFRRYSKNRLSRSEHDNLCNTLSTRTDRVRTQSESTSGESVWRDNWIMGGDDFIKCTHLLIDTSQDHIPRPAENDSGHTVQNGSNSNVNDVIYDNPLELLKRKTEDGTRGHIYAFRTKSDRELLEIKRQNKLINSDSDQQPHQSHDRNLHEKSPFMTRSSTMKSDVTFQQNHELIAVKDQDRKSVVYTAINKRRHSSLPSRSAQLRDDVEKC